MTFSDSFFFSILFEMKLAKKTKVKISAQNVASRLYVTIPCNIYTNNISHKIVFKCFGFVMEMATE